MGVCASAPLTLPSTDGPAVWAPTPRSFAVSEAGTVAGGEASKRASSSSSSAVALASWARPGGGEGDPAGAAKPRVTDPDAPLTLAVRAPPPRPAALTSVAASAAGSAPPPSLPLPRARPLAPARPPPPALGALGGEDEDELAPGALTPGRAHNQPTGPPPTMLQAPIDALPPSIGLAYAPPYIPPPGPPRPASPRPLTSTEAAATAADAAWRPARRRAVLVACGYGQEEDVATGPVVDAGAVRTLLATKFNFQPGETVFLSDAQPHARLLPTKANILAAARWLVAGAGPADSLVFAFFGRGAGADGAPVGWVRRGGEEGGVPQPQPRPAAPPGGAGGGSDSDGDGGGGGSADENAPPSPSSVEAVTATSSPVKGAPAAASVAGAAGEGAAASASAATSAAAAASLAAFFGATAAAAHAPPSPSRHSTRASVPSSPAHSTATPRPAPGLASPAAPGARRGVPPAPTATSTTSQASATFLPAPPPAPVAASGTPGAGFCAALATSDWAAGKGLAPSDLHAALVAPLPPGARLLACIDAAGGRFSLGLPAAAAVRPDGWPAWEAAGSRAVGAGAPGAGEAVLIAGDTPAPPPLVVAPPPSSSPSLTPPQPAHAQPASGALAFALVQAVEQGHTGSWAALVRALRYAVRNGGPAFGGGGGGGGHGGGAGGGFGGPAALAPPGAARPPAVTASRRFDFNRPFLL